MLPAALEDATDRMIRERPTLRSATDPTAERMPLAEYATRYLPRHAPFFYGKPAGNGRA